MGLDLTQFNTFQLFFCLSVFATSVSSLLFFYFMRLPKRELSRRIKRHAIIVYVMFALNSLVTPFLGILPDWLYIALSVITLLPICYGIYFLFDLVSYAETPSPFSRPFFWIHTAVVTVVCALAAYFIEHSFGITRMIININASIIVIAGAHRLINPKGRTGRGRMTLVKLYYFLGAVMVTVPFAFHWLRDFALTQSLVLIIMALMIHLTFGSICAVILIKQIEVNFKNSITDGQTRLLNRRYFMDKSKRLMDQEDIRTFSIIICDLDHFKLINDNNGHAVGDQVIEYFSRLMCQCAPANSLCARLGGEEFAILIPGVKKDVAFQVANNIKQCLTKKSKLIDSDIRVTASYGITDSTDKQLSEMLKLADQALYEAKANGRNTAVVV